MQQTCNKFSIYEGYDIQFFREPLEDANCDAVKLFCVTSHVVLLFCPRISFVRGNASEQKQPLFSVYLTFHI